MNQIMRVGEGVVIAFDRQLHMDDMHQIQTVWRDQFPGIPMLALPEAQIIQQGETTLFQFTGDVSPTVVAEFQRWWEGVTRAIPKD